MMPLLPVFDARYVLTLSRSAQQIVPQVLQLSYSPSHSGASDRRETQL